MVYVSHRIEEVMRLCDRITVLRDGAVIATKAVADTSATEIIRMMIGRQVSEAYPVALAPARQEVALATRNLESKRLERRRSFELREGEVVGVAGLAGAGQGHLLRLLAGADKATGGRIAVGGRDGRPTGLAAAWKKGLAYVPPERRSEGLVLSRPIYENITLPHLSRINRGAFLNRRRERAIAGEHGAEVRLSARPWTALL